MPELGEGLQTNTAAAIGARSLSAKDMEAIAKKLRRHIVSMTGEAGSGHPGGSLSAVEIVTALYFGLLRHKHQTPTGQTGIDLS